MWRIVMVRGMISKLAWLGARVRLWQILLQKWPTMPAVVAILEWFRLCVTARSEGSVGSGTLAWRKSAYATHATGIGGGRAMSLASRLRF